MMTDPKTIQEELNQPEPNTILTRYGRVLDPQTRYEDLTPKQKAALDEIYRLMSLRFEGGSADLAERHHELDP